MQKKLFGKKRERGDVPQRWGERLVLTGNKKETLFLLKLGGPKKKKISM